MLSVSDLLTENEALRKRAEEAETAFAEERLAANRLIAKYHTVENERDGFQQKWVNALHAQGEAEHERDAALAQNGITCDRLNNRDRMYDDVKAKLEIAIEAERSIRASAIKHDEANAATIEALQKELAKVRALTQEVSEPWD